MSVTVQQRVQPLNQINYFGVPILFGTVTDVDGNLARVEWETGGMSWVWTADLIAA